MLTTTFDEFKFFNSFRFSFNSEVGESLLEVIFSDPILRDVRKLELKGPGGPAPAVAETAAGKVTRTNKKIVELDTDDRAGNESSIPFS